MLKQLMDQVKTLQGQLDDLKNKNFAVNQTTIPTPIEADDTMGRAMSNIFERQRTEPDNKVGGVDSKHSTFSFNNQPQIFSHTLTKGLPVLEESKGYDKNAQYQSQITESKNLESEYVDDFETNHLNDGAGSNG